MIVVIGSGCLRGDGSDAAPSSLSDRIAIAAVADGASVERVARVGDDPTGDALLVALARVGVGHVAVLRDAAHPTARCPDADAADVGDVADLADEDALVEHDGAIDPARDGPALDRADVGLAFRYLTDYRVVVAVHPTTEIAAEAAAAADWAQAHLAVVTRPSDAVPPSIPPDALVIAADEGPGDASGLAARVGAYAAAIDAGATPATAFALLTAEADAIAGTGVA